MTRGHDRLRRWTPVPGALTGRLLARQATLSAEARAEHLAAAVATLGRCASPQEAGPHAAAHLVVGEVQSGKTLAFTTLMALAHDRGFRLIVVVAGTKRNLMAQTVQRLRDDLMKGDGGINPWRRLENPSMSDERELLQGLLQPNAGTTTVCFVLKDARRLGAVEKLLGALATKMDMTTVPTLVIDDEADQASPNRKVRQGDESAIYAGIGAVRETLPRHDFLMYTATPQAPLLIKLSDQLSPETVTILRSGRAYVGGRDLFVDHAESFVRIITDDDVVTATDPDATEPPPSLRRALATFLLALTLAQQRGHPRPLSMLVHPAVQRDVHDKHYRWVRAIVDDLVAPLRIPQDIAFKDALRGDIQAAYDDLASSCDDIPELDRLARDVPRFADHVAIRKVNQDAAEEIKVDDWDDHAGWIVIGGAKLDRGFTVKNLAVTYMPRGRGVGNADTVQQRGRFFGYKREYLDLCRGWFSVETAEAFRHYVDHEQTLLRSLSAVENDASPLRHWRRELLLSPDLSPTRREVISLDTNRKMIFSKSGWCDQSGLIDPAAAAANRTALRRFLARLDGLTPHPRDPRPSPHLVGRVPTADVLALLDGWGVSPQDADRFLGAALVLGILRDRDQADAIQVLLMDGWDSVKTLANARARSSRPRDARSIQLFQGPGSGRNAGYPGDRSFGEEEVPTLAIFGLDLRGIKPSYDDVVPALALHVANAAVSLVVEP
ncbi:MAG TPA: Z1 domain-containing protein [Conexibacter sp.]|nr:Z1 domain-containing protein [Conexibacter sp.]